MTLDPKTQAAVTVEAAKAVDPRGHLRLLPSEPIPSDPAEVIRPWERHPRESDRDWFLFRSYLNSGYPEGPGGPMVVRDVKALAEAIQVPWSELAGLARSFDWLPRAGAWDRLVERRRMAADLTLVAAQREAHGRITRKMRNLVEMELDKLLARAMDPLTPVMSAKEVMAMADLTIRLERLFAGEESASPTRASGDLTPTDLSRLELGELEALHRIVQAAKAR